jgi:hypothetical protein
MLDYINDSMTAVSTHMYSDGDKSVDTTPTKLTSERGDYSDWDGFMSYLVAEGKRMKKAVYLGETNCGYDGTTMTTRTAKQSVTVAREIANAALKNDLQLMMYWNYDDKPDYNAAYPNNNNTAGIEWSWNERWDKGMGILQIIKEYNAKIDEKHSSTAM